jgi:antitoxin (DNA-binding transcriptional repressor) of toxin-antitoxin stability system
MKSLNISEVRMRLPDLIAGVAQSQEPIVVMRYGAPMAMIVPIKQGRNEQIRYPLRGQPIAVAKDFDDPMPELWNALGVAEKRAGYGERKA